MTEALGLLARLIGALYIAGAVFLLVKTPGRWRLAVIEDGLSAGAAASRKRVAWLLTGAAAMAAAGAALIMLDRLAAPLTAALVLHQGAYFLVYFRLARRREDPDLAPARSTVNAAALSLAVFALTFHLWRSGALT